MKAATRDMIQIFLVLALCIVLQRVTFEHRVAWPGLPPAPDKSSALIYGFGDVQFSYRNVGMILQNAGDTGGRVTNLKDYNYENVESWLWLADALDDRASYVPGLAAYYFGATKNPDELRHLINYLAKVGSDTEGERWRWLAHAVYLARYRIEDQQMALDLANKLAALDVPDMPIWTKQMPAYVMSNTGQKKAARDLMLTIIATDKSIDPAEVNQTCYYINKNLREPGDGMETNQIYDLFCANNPNAVVNNK